MFRKAAPGEVWCGFRTKGWEGLLSRKLREKISGREGSGVTTGLTEIWPEGEIGNVEQTRKGAIGAYGREKSSRCGVEGYVGTDD